MMEESFIIGELAATYFVNEKNFYRVMRIHIEETNTLFSEKEIVVTGHFASIQEGMSYKFMGELVTHPRYGVQFQCQTYETVQITNEDGLIRYLSGPDFPGIGQILASRIVKQLGVEAIETILNDSKALQHVEGLSRKKQIMLWENLKAKQGNQEIFIQLAKLGFSTPLAAKVHDVYGGETLERLRENPYQLIRDVEGFGFKHADQLAEKLNLAMDSAARIQGGLYYCLLEYSYQAGDTIMSQGKLLAKTQALLNGAFTPGISEAAIAAELAALVEQGELKRKGEQIALPWLYEAEETIARKIHLLCQQDALKTYPKAKIARVLDDLEVEFNMDYGAEQRQAIAEALGSNLYILTGGPGTGKTTVLRGLVECYRRLNALSDGQMQSSEEPILQLAAPTGRAAKRMSEVIGYPAGTIHRLLGLTGEEAFLQEPDKTLGLEGELLIIDEVSMIDTQLMAQLLMAVPPYMQIILVGDADQLPSVGPGQVLHDLLAFGQVPSRHLEEIYRQSDDSTISYLARDVRLGHIPKDLTQRYGDRSFIYAHKEQLNSLLRQVSQAAVKKGYQMWDVQVLAPMYAGLSGIDQINQELQEALNPNPDGKRREVSIFERIFRVGDKVLQLKNQAELNVFNGDIGRIVAIFYAKETESKTDEIVVAFDDDLEVTYGRSDWNQLTLAYCTSIHKAQGSEFPIVILPLVSAYRRMLKRNLLYTAVSRAKQALILCGEPQAFEQAVLTPDNGRHTLLLHFLKGKETSFDETAESKEKRAGSSGTEGREEAPALTPGAGGPSPKPSAGPPHLTPRMVAQGSIDPLIGMEGLSPYQF